MVLFFCMTKIYLLCISKYFKIVFTMEAKNYLDDLKDIKSMMAKSTQFISLSGLSGLIAGIYALIGAFIADTTIESYFKILKIVKFTKEGYEFTINDLEFKLIQISVLVLIVSIVTAYLLTLSKAKRINETLWNSVSKKLLLSFCIPLATGGILGILLLKSNYWNLIAPITLIFYGLACENASKFTFRDVRYLGITQILLGLISIQYPGYALYFWAAGFGVCHIIYGSLMYFKYDRNPSTQKEN